MMASSAGETRQEDVIAFLRKADAYTPRPDRVDVIETHGALVFLAGSSAFKIKRAVRLPYLDFSTLELRRQCAQRELEINQPNAPEIYLGLVPIVRRATGELAIGGDGEPVEWAVHMARFDQSALLSAVARTRGIDPDLALRLADAVHLAHCHAPSGNQISGFAGRLARVVETIVQTCAASADPRITEAAVSFGKTAQAQLERVGPLLAEREGAGLVRRCHGDLHLGNIVLIDNRPVLFDAIEFDEQIATVDIFYDLAFLLMDLDRHGHRAAANLLLNRYLVRSRGIHDLASLAALPVFLGVRAGVRAMVGVDKARQGPASDRLAALDEAASYLFAAGRYLSPAPARIIAVGGLSGTGKSTLASALAPLVDPSPGAVHLRSDVERKVLAGMEETDRLAADWYTPETSARVYNAILEKARTTLTAGHGVIVDAVFARPEERAAVEAIARRCGVPFTGLWLEAPPATLAARVTSRTGDASDATAAVVAQQLSYDIGPISWARIDAGSGAAATLSHARAALGFTPGQSPADQA